MCSQNPSPNAQNLVQKIIQDGLKFFEDYGIFKNRYIEELMKDLATFLNALNFIYYRSQGKLGAYATQNNVSQT